MNPSAIESIAVTAPPVLFLIVLFGGEALMRRRNIDMGGTPPIRRPLFAVSKYLIVVVWAITALRGWGIDCSFIAAPRPPRLVSLIVWFAGFALLLAGRFGMGAAFRIGSPREDTRLVQGGLFRFSRNPMYVGVYATLVAATLYTASPIVLAIAAFVIVVHHRIVLAEERCLAEAFGGEYAAYRRRVRRYL